MKAIILKELREARLMMTGLTALFLIVLAACWKAASTMHGPWGGLFQSHPIMSEGFQIAAGFGCALAGVIAGFWAIQKERQKDLWAFLIHRPLRRERVFLAKTLGALAVYGAVTVPPLIFAVLWSLREGRLAAPFYLEMALPLVAYGLAGIGYTFAGLLIGLRQAKWFGSRLLPLAACLPFSVLIALVPEFWHAAVAACVLVLILAPSAWGSFMNDGVDGGQAAPCKLALNGTMTIGSWVAVAGAVTLTVALVSSLSERVTMEHHEYCEVLEDGSIAKTSYNPGAPYDAQQHFTPFIESPWKLESGTNRNERPARATRVASGALSDGESWGRQPHYNHPTRFFLPVLSGHRGWYFVSKIGRFALYDIQERRLLGSMGPAAFAAGTLVGPDRFDVDFGRFNLGLAFNDTEPRLYWGSQVVYRIDLEQRTARELFRTPPGDTVVACITVPVGEGQPAASRTWIATRQSLILTEDGREVARTRFVSEPSFVAGSLAITPIREAGLILQFYPSHAQYRDLAMGMPSTALWVSNTGEVVQRASVPPRSVFGEVQPIEKVALAVVGSPVLQVTFDSMRGTPPTGLMGVWWLMGLIGALGALAVGFRQGLRPVALTGWGILGACTGLAGLLGMLAVQHWPARVPCPECGGRRPVTLTHCPRCGALFSPPKADGTEIFEPEVAGGREARLASHRDA